MAPDAATLPSPPTFAPGAAFSRRNTGGMVPGERQIEGAGGHQNGSSPRFPNIKDLQDEAAALNVNENTPVSSSSSVDFSWYNRSANLTRIAHGFVEYRARCYRQIQRVRGKQSIR
jgi:hypothetical protein